MNSDDTAWNALGEAIAWLLAHTAVWGSLAGAAVLSLGAIFYAVRALLALF